jgi:LuxR family maltose regulon positive regulatory protein
VEETTLLASASGADAILVGTPAWYAWLEQATTFAFVGARGRFTARKERRGRSGWYWKACRKRAGRVSSAYLGKTADLTLERLQQVAATLARPQSPADAPAGTPAPGPAAHLLATKLYGPPTRANFIIDYLTEEVLDRQPAHLQTFLLPTSILDRLCGPLCDAVLLGAGAAPQTDVHHTPSAYTQTVLEELERANLFLIPLDDQRKWYRYHHLFAEVLRTRLTSGATVKLVATLHRRASA